MERTAWRHIHQRSKTVGICCMTRESEPRLCDNLEGVGWGGRREQVSRGKGHECTMADPY